HDLPESQVVSESLYCQIHYGWSPLFSLMTDRYQYIDSPKAELYDIQKDPGETNNLLDSNPALAKTMQGRIKDLQAKDAAGAPKKTIAETDLESQEILKSLGYIGSGPSEKTKEAGKNVDPKDKIEIVENLHSAFGEMRKGQLDEAQAKIDWILKQDPEMVDAHFLQGMVASRKQNYPLAVQAFKDTLDLRPDHLYALFNEALVYRKTGQADMALSGFMEVLKRDPHYVHAMVNIAEIYAEQKNTKL